MRSKRNRQLGLNFQPSNLRLTREHFARYDGISRILDDSPGITDAVHRDLAKIVKNSGRYGPGRACEYATDTVLRMLICQIVEGEDLRGIVIRVDDSSFLRCFVRIHNGPMMDASTLCRFKNAIRPMTWKKINRLLGESAVKRGQITGDQLRFDTTAFETNIRYPSDSGLLCDTYRVLARHLRAARELDPEIAASHRFHDRRAKKLHLSITRKAAKKGSSSPDLIPLYKPLIGLVEAVLDLAGAAVAVLDKGAACDQYGTIEQITADYLATELRNYSELGRRVVQQARRRVLHGEQLAATEKLYSIFEPHTELLKRGKAGKPIEFGHMVLIQQVKGCFITDYGVFSRRPVDHSLVDPALKSHEELFGKLPREIAGDRAFHESDEKTKQLAQVIPVVSIPKMGQKNQRERERESHLAFKLAQAFRAGAEGTISFLKRALRMFRCLNKGWEHYQSTVGATIFAHNLLVLVRSG